jgi:hypothetical protein
MPKPVRKVINDGRVRPIRPARSARWPQAAVIAFTWSAVISSAHGQKPGEALACPNDPGRSRLVEMADTTKDCIKTWGVQMNLDADWSQPRGRSDVYLIIDFDGAIYRMPDRPGELISEPSDLSDILARLPASQHPTIWLEWHNLTQRFALADAVAQMNKAGYVPKAREGGSGPKLPPPLATH